MVDLSRHQRHTLFQLPSCWGCVPCLTTPDIKLDNILIQSGKSVPSHDFWHSLTYNSGNGQGAYWCSPSHGGSVAQLYLTLRNPIDCSPPGSSVHGIFQARVLELESIPFSRGSSQPRDRNRVSRIAGRCFTIWATREALHQSRIKAKKHSRETVPGWESSLWSQEWLYVQRAESQWRPFSHPVTIHITLLLSPYLSVLWKVAVRYPVTGLLWKMLFSRSVGSDSLQPHGLQHARLPCPLLSSKDKCWESYSTL